MILIAVGSDQVARMRGEPGWLPAIADEIFL